MTLNLKRPNAGLAIVEVRTNGNSSGAKKTMCTIGWLLIKKNKINCKRCIFTKVGCEGRVIRSQSETAEKEYVLHAEEKGLTAIGHAQ